MANSRYGTIDTLLRKGTIVYAFPALNTYEVKPELHHGDGNLTIKCTALMSGSATTTVGVAGVPLFTPGTMVYFTMLPTKTTTQIGMDSAIGIILGPVPFRSLKGASDVASFPMYNLFGPSGIDYTTEQVTDAVISSRAIPLVSTDRSYGIPCDALPGDVLQVGSFGSFNALSSSYAGIGGGATTRLEFFSFKQLARFTAENYEMNSPVLESGYHLDWAESWLFYDRKAASLKEGLGVRSPSTQPFKKGNSKLQAYEPAIDNQQGIFRKESYFGPAVNGYWEFWETPENKGSDLRSWNNADNPPFGILSEKRSFAGDLKYRSASGFSFVKSPFVPVMRNLKPETEEPKSSDVPERQWKDDPANAEILPYYHHLASTLERFEADYNLANYDNKILRSRREYWRMYNRAEVESDYNITNSDYTTIPALEETEVEYSDIKTIEIKDAITGDRKVSLSEAIFKILEDGTIILSDGYGAEIRLSRGTVTITCPGDMKILPGRDLVEMIPRNRVLNAGKDLYIQSANGSVSLKAEQNLSVVSGNSSSGGILLLENKSIQPMINDQWLKSDSDTNPPINHGILIKAENSLGVLGQDVYLGVYDKNDSSDKGLARNKPGRVTIDSAGGTAAFIGNTCYAKFKENLFMAAGTGSNVSALSITKSAVACYAMGTVGFIARSVKFSGGSGSIKVPELTKSGMEENEVVLQANSVNLTLNGNIALTGSLTALGSVRSSSVNSGFGKFGNGGRDYWGGGGQSPSPFTVDPISASYFGSAGLSFKTGVNPDLNALYTGKCLKNTGFYYPGSARLGTDKFALVAARWQHLLTGSSIWTEPVVKTPDDRPTMIWPGKSKWEEKSLVKLDSRGILKEKQKLIEQYTINCSQLK